MCSDVYGYTLGQYYMACRVVGLIKNNYLYNVNNKRYAMRRFLYCIMVAPLFVLIACGGESDKGVKPQFEPYMLSMESDECSVEICYQQITNCADNSIFAHIEAVNYDNLFYGYTVEPMDVAVSARLMAEDYMGSSDANLDFEDVGCRYVVDQQVHYVRNEKILCYETYVESDTQGAHGIYHLWYECFDLATGQLYDFNYLYEDEWGDAIRELMVSRLREQESGAYLDSIEALSLDGSVLITDTGITIVFVPYALGSFDAGIISLSLTDEEIAAAGAPILWAE